MAFIGGALAQDEAAAPAVSEKPHPALMAPLAAQRTLISVAQAGTGLVAVGDRGHILTSADGKQWTQVPSPVDVMLNRVRFRDAKVGFAVGHDAAIVATKDGGTSWNVVHFDSTSRPLYDLAFLDDQHLFAIGGYGTYLESADGGASWTPRDFPIGSLGQHFNAITWLGDGSLLVAGEKGLLMRSKDKGATWDLLDSPYTGSFFGVLSHGGAGAVVYGLRGNIYVAADVSRCPVLKVDGYDPYSRETVTDAARLAKLGWKHLSNPSTESLFGGAADGATDLLVGVNGTIVRVDPATGAVTAPRAPDGQTLADVTLRDGHWIAAGRRGVTDLGDLGSHAGATGSH